LKKSPAAQGTSAVDAIRRGDLRAIARAITAIENREPGANQVVRELFPHTGRAVLIGVTGAPGTGKSSLVNTLSAHFRAQGKTVGVIAVDPTSPFTGGALLGDRIRMQQHATDDGIYIRSMATRGFLGGLARATGDAALVLDAAAKDLILIETVGVGQDEVDIVRLADITLVLLVGGMGDDVQSFKAGVMEIADVFVVNKADRGDTDRLEQELKVMLGLSPRQDGWSPPIVKTSATAGTGVPTLAAALNDFLAYQEQEGLRNQKRVDRWRARLLDLIRQEALERVIQSGVGRDKLDDYARMVAHRERDPYSVVAELLRAAGIVE